MGHERRSGNDEGDVLAVVVEDPTRRAALEAMASLELPDAWLAAGFVRNAWWDRLFGVDSGAADLDVVYFDPEDSTPRRDRDLEARLAASLPGQDWSVKNQARMHARNGHSPYTSSADALRYWPETATCVGVRLGPDGEPELLAPYGIEDLLGGVVRPSPRADPAVFRERLEKKAWATRWPGLRVSPPPAPR
jgi:hypothetical protein